MNLEISFWQAFAAVISLFILWSMTLATVMSWLNTKFSLLLTKSDYDTRHLVLQQRVEAINDTLTMKIEQNYASLERRIRHLEIWAASRGSNGPGSYKFSRDQE